MGTSQEETPRHCDIRAAYGAIVSLWEHTYDVQTDPHAVPLPVGPGGVQYENPTGGGLLTARTLATCPTA